jgi:hypothetical protein
VRRVLQKESIYTMKPARRGHSIPEARHADTRDLEDADELFGL